MKMIKMRWLKAFFLIVGMMLVMIPITVKAEQSNVYQKNEDGTYTLNNLDVKILDFDGEVLETIDTVTFSQDISNVEGGFLRYATPEHCVEYSVVEKIYSFKYGQYEYYGTDNEKFDKNPYVKAYINLTEEESRSYVLGTSWTEEKLLAWVRQELEIVTKCTDGLGNKQETITYNEFDSKDVVSVKIPIYNEIDVLDGENTKTIYVENYIKSNYKIDVKDSNTSVVATGYTPISSYEMTMQWKTVPIKSIWKKPVVLLKFDDRELDFVNNNFYVSYYKEDNRIEQNLLKVNNGILEGKSNGVGIFTISSKEMPIIATTEDGYKITEAHLRKSGLDADDRWVTLDIPSTTAKLNEANTELIVTGFLAWAEKDAMYYEIPTEYTIQLGWNNGVENQRKDTLKINITEEASKSIDELKKYDSTFLITMGTQSYGLFFYSNITGPTSLGFNIHKGLKNAHWDFYGGGYDFFFMEFPYSEPGAVQFLYQDDKNGTIGVKNLRTLADLEYSDISIGTEKDPLRIKYAGLHYLVPKGSDAANSIVMGEGITQNELKNVMVTTAEAVTGSVKAVLEIEEKQVIDANVFEVVSGKNNIDAVEIEHGGIGYRIDRNDIQRTNIDMTVGAKENTSETIAKLGDEAVFSIDFEHNGDLPGNTQVTVPVEIEDGEYTWSYLNSNNELVESQKVTVKDGKVQATITHCSTYVLTKNSSINTGNDGSGGNKPEENPNVPSETTKKDKDKTISKKPIEVAIPSSVNTLTTVKPVGKKETVVEVMKQEEVIEEMASADIESGEKEIGTLTTEKTDDESVELKDIETNEKSFSWWYLLAIPVIAVVGGLIFSRRKEEGL